MELTGYVRSDGRTGFRNHVLVLPLTGCLMSIGRRIAERVRGATCFAHPHGCDFQGDDFELFGTILEHTATHPNVGGVVFLAMGCASALSLELPRKVGATGRPVKVLNAYDGTTKAIEAGVRTAQAMANELRALARQPVPLSALTIGAKCGASDENSSRHCHPVVGRACDMLVERGATVVLSEDCELVASAPLLAQRAVTPEIAAAINALPDAVNSGWLARFGHSLEEAVLKSGLSHDDWVNSSLGSAAKAGSSPITGFFDLAETVSGPGLVILNGPNTDLECVTCLAAAGCNLTLFTTGRGTPVGSPTAVTLKITATARTYERMGENIDVSVAAVADGGESVESAAKRVVDAVIAAAGGEATKSERLEHWEVAIPIRGVTY